ncbi:MAG: hypothetical protein EXX96DRAFT_582842 [Benjaminiella poitrasii]|nr:MAG: hypothetical protein EXX96DRAFT_582842 [Benjaminiella poitrasii]
MASKLDQALDDVIRERRRDRPSTKRTFTSSSSSRRGPLPTIRKRFTPNNGPVIRSFVRTTEKNRGVDGQWAHDMFNEDTSDRRTNILSRLGNSRSTTNNRARGVEISIENLHYNVTEKDVEELFSTVATVVRTRLFYDPSGRSTGQAVVRYETQHDADRAIEKYNNVELDGQPMRIQLKEYTPRTNTRSREGGSGRRYESSNNRGSRNRRQHQDSRSGRRSTTTRESKTQEELDKEMDSYMKSNDDNADAMMLD